MEFSRASSPPPTRAALLSIPFSSVVPPESWNQMVSEATRLRNVERDLEGKNRQLEECREKIRELEGRLKKGEGEEKENLGGGGDRKGKLVRRVAMDRVTGFNNYVRAFCGEIGDFVRKVRVLAEEDSEGEEEEEDDDDERNAHIPEAHMERVLALIREKEASLKTVGGGEAAVLLEQPERVDAGASGPPPAPFESALEAEEDYADDGDFEGPQIVATRSLSIDADAGPSCSSRKASPPRDLAVPVRNAIFGQFTTTQEDEDEKGTGGDENSLPEAAKHARDPGNLLRCICGHTATAKYNLTKHIKYALIERKFSCGTCSQKFVNFSTLRNHLLHSHKDVKAYKRMKHLTGCSKCGMTFPNVAAFNTHRRTSTSCRTGSTAKTWEPPRAVVAQLTAPGSGNSRKVVTRKKTVGVLPTKKFRCAHCPQAFKILSQLQNHRRRAHKIAPKGFEIGCVDCGLSFKSRVEHRAHRSSVHNTVTGPKKWLKKEKKSVANPGGSGTASGARVVHEVGKDPGGRPRCSCGQLFRSSSGARRHVRLSNLAVKEKLKPSA